MASTSTIATRKLFYFFDDSFQPLSFTPHVMYMPENSHVHQLRTSIYDNTDPENSFPTKYREHPRGRQFRIFKAPKSVLIALASFQPAFTYATAIPGDSVLLPSDALPSRTQKSFFLVVLPSLSTPLPSLPLVHSNKFIRFHTRGKNFFKDLDLNPSRFIASRTELDLRVDNFRTKLSSPRTIPNESYETIARCSRKSEFEKYLKPPISDVTAPADSVPANHPLSSQASSSPPTATPLVSLATELEAQHFVDLSTRGHRKIGFAEAKDQAVDADFFVPYFRSILSRNQNKSKSAAFVCSSSYKWPLTLYGTVESENNAVVSYVPISGHSLWIAQQVIFISETHSQGGSNVHKLHLEAIALTKLIAANPANIFFVLPTIYIDENYCAIVRYYYCLDKTHSDVLYYEEIPLDLTTQPGALKFATMLYNMADQPPVLTSYASDIAQSLFHNVAPVGSRPLSFFRQKRKRMIDDEGDEEEENSTSGDSSSPSHRSGCSCTQCLMDDSGFRPVTRSATTTRTSALKTRIQKRKPLSELPSHLQSAGYTFVVQNNNSVVTVDRRGHTFIAKKVPRDSPELDILKRCKKRSVPNTIRFTDIIVKPKSPSYVILPRLSVLGADLVIGGAIDRVRPHLPTMTYDLARGLAHLHRLRIAHLDVKPNNLVYDQHFTLYLIDFDHAVQLRSGEDMIKGRAGTPGWSAPEVNSGKAYDPIMADRYSCGLVFNLFRGLARLDPHLDHELNDFSLRLRSRKPTARPSLTTWVPSSDA